MQSRNRNRLSDAELSRVERVYDAVIRLPIEQRKAYLDREMASDGDLRSEVDLLLSSHSGIGSFLENPLGARMREGFDKATSEIPFRAGDRVGDFVLFRELGRGGFGTVFLALQESLGREVALKISRDFGEEARTVAQLEHDHIIKVYSQTVDGGRRFLCMQYVPGATLADSKPSVEQALWIGARIAEALDYAHRKGVVHLDVKPSNILLHVSGRPLLADFNVSLQARAMQEGSISHFGGTERYMAPEQRRVLEDRSPDRFSRLVDVDQRADIYSLGVVLDELLPAAERTPDITHMLARAKALLPADRHGSAAELARELDGCLELRRVRSTLQVPTNVSANPFRNTLLTIAAAQLSAVGGALCLLGGEGSARVWFVPFFAVLTALALLVGKRICFDRLSRATSRGDTDEAHRQLRHLPRRMATLVLLTWAAPLFVAVLPAWHLGYAPFGLAQLIVGILSFALFAGAATAIVADAMTMRNYFPRVWLGIATLREEASRELSDFSRRLRVAGTLAVLIPPVAGALALSIAAEAPSARRDAVHRYRPLVTKAFRHARGREPQPIEIEDWAGRLSTASEGLPTACVFLSLVDSPESHRTTVARWYQTYLLDRRPLAQLQTDPGVIAAAEELEQGAAYPAVLGRLLALRLPASDMKAFLKTVRVRTFDPLPEGPLEFAFSPRDDRERVAVTYLRGKSFSRTVVDEWFKLLLGWSTRSIGEDPSVRYWTEHLQVLQDHVPMMAAIMSNNDYTGLKLAPQIVFPTRDSCFTSTSQRGPASEMSRALPTLSQAALWLLALAALGIAALWRANVTLSRLRDAFAGATEERN